MERVMMLCEVAGSVVCAEQRGEARLSELLKDPCRGRLWRLGLLLAPKV